MANRYKITIEYDGSLFYGWQRQKDKISVQQTLEEALFKITQKSILVEGSGRTDTGVHALGQVGHFDLEREFSPFKLQEAFNFYLKNSGVAVIHCEHVASDFHARFSAKDRSYKYYIFNRRVPSPLTMHRMWHVHQPLDFDVMQKASLDFIGHHDFSSFRAAECQSTSPVKTLTQFSLEQVDNNIICATIASRSFLYNQVRIMIGTLKEIGEGKRPVNDIGNLLMLKDRTKSGITAPPHGLYFYNVTYTPLE